MKIMIFVSFNLIRHHFAAVVENQVVGWCGCALKNKLFKYLFKQAFLNKPKINTSQQNIMNFDVPNAFKNWLITRIYEYLLHTHTHFRFYLRAFLRDEKEVEKISPCHGVVNNGSWRRIR